MIAVSLWGLRLTYNWFYTFKGLSHQDWRYTMLKEKSGKLYFFVNYFGIHMFPTLVVYLCILPAVLAIVNVVEFNFIAIIGFILCLIGVSLELFADISMQKHRKNGSGNLIRNGLWKYSRHPNYLGEITMWFGIMLLSIMVVKESPYLVMGAIINMLMFIFISIPMADKRQSQKEGYDLYKEETRMLLPVPKFKK